MRFSQGKDSSELSFPRFKIAFEGELASKFKLPGKGFKRVCGAVSKTAVSLTYV